MNASGLNEFLSAPAPAGFDPRNTPVWLWTVDGTRVLWASRAALVVSGARTLGALTGQVFGASMPAVARMAVLARELGPESPPRLERLRFYFGARSEMLTCLVKLSPLREGGQALLVAAMGLRVTVPEAMEEHPPAALASSRAPAEMEPAETEPVEDAGPGDAPRAAPVLAPAVVDAAPEPVRLAWMDEDPAVRRPIRFTWASDSEGRLTALSAPFATVTGLETAALLGRAWPALLPLAGPDDLDTLQHFLSMTETWSAASVLWRPTGTDTVVPLDLSGVPMFDLDRVFGGFRGFGVFRLDAAHEAERDSVQDAAPAEAEPEAPAPADTTPALEGPHAEAGEPPVSEAPARVEPEADPGVAWADAGSPDERAVEEAPAGTVPEASPAPVEETEHAPAALPIGELRTVIAAQFGSPKVVPLRAGPPPDAAPDASSLSQAERIAFREIARTLAQRVPAEAAALAAAPDVAPAAIAEPSPARAVAEDVSPTRLALPILERLPLGVLVLRGDEALFANRALLDLTGYEDLGAFRADQGAEKLFQGRFGETIADAAPFVVIATRAGEKVPVEARVQTVDWDGRPATLLSFRRASELETNASAASMEEEAAAHRSEADEALAMLDIATDGVVSLDHRGRILAMNRAAEALFGFDQKEVAGEPFTLLLSPESHPAANEYLEGLRQNGVAVVLNDGREVMGRERKGGRMPLFMALGRVNDAVEPKYAAVLRDITQWKRAEAELVDAKRQAERANAHKSDFLAKVSHEVRTPLNAIIGFAEVMMEERLGPIGTDRYKEYLADIQESGRHVMSLVNDLLDLSKIEAGRMELTFTSVDLNAMVASCISMMQPQANRDRVIMRSHLATRLPRVVADERSVRQIVLNLLSNATKFTDAGGQVIVSTTLTDRGDAAVRVRDTGIGMDEKDVERALEPFRRISTSHPKGGTGLGLPLTKALAEANRAKLSVRSRPNEGTLVELIFPSARVLAE